MESINCLTDCPRIGHCCKVFYLHGPEDKDVLERFIDEETPFRRLHTFEDRPQCVCSCDNLGPDGLCRDYENRPDLCRKFEPGTDALCILSCGPPTPWSLLQLLPEFAALRWQ